MVVGDTEIEVKFPLTEELFSEVKGKLEKLAKSSGSRRNVDTYYTPAHRDFLREKYPYEWLSIRQRGDKTIVNYKHWHPAGEPIKTHCDEFETEIASKDQLEKLFAALDLKKLVTVDKQRETYIFEDKFEIVLDVVKDLGHFIEIETMKPLGTVDEARRQLFEFAKKLGVDTSKADQKGYPMLLIEKKELG